MIDKDKEETVEQEQPVELRDEETEEVAGGVKKNIYSNPGSGVKFE